MEEQVGELWHKFITRMAEKSYPHAAVQLDDIAPVLGIYFRALGGDAGLRIEKADATLNHGRRGWLQRLAGTHTKTELAWLDDMSLRMPGRIASFDDAALNKDLYFWLAALATCDADDNSNDWLQHNQALSQRALQQFPGLQPRYQRLLQAHLQQRPQPERLPARAATDEIAVREALQQPGSVHDYYQQDKQPPAAVPLWLHPQPPRKQASRSPDDASGESAQRPQQQRQTDMARRQAEEVDAENPERGLVAIRMENILTWGDFVNVDRAQDEEDDLEKAENVARDMDKISVSRDQRTAKSALKFDLDLPGEADDDAVLDDGLLLPEWDWKKRRLIPDHCRIVSLLSADAQAMELPPHLRAQAKNLRRRFQVLAPQRSWQYHQLDGQDIDLDAYLSFITERRLGHAGHSDNLYRELIETTRDMSCVLMADLSLSTDSYIDDHHRVIDVIRDSLFLFSEALSISADRFALYGFSSRKRNPVRVHTLKTFDEKYSGRIRGRIQAIKPGYYTRMGAAIRYATRQLEQQHSSQRLLLLLTDGKPNDLDQYEGRYGIEDTRQAVLDARRAGVQPLCITIDQKASTYLPHLFGADGYVVIHKPSQLPSLLPLIYARMTRWR